MNPKDQLQQFLSMRNALPLALDPAKTALLVIDMQPYQTSLEGSLLSMIANSFPGMLDYYLERIRGVVLPTIEGLVSTARSLGVKILHLRFASRHPEGSDLIPALRQANEAARVLGFESAAVPYMDDPSTQILDRVDPQASDTVIVKPSSSPFSTTDIDARLRSDGIENVLVSGVVTNLCVESTARDAADRGFQTVIIEDATAGWSAEIEAASIRSFGMSFGWTMKSVEVLKRLQA